MTLRRAAVFLSLLTLMSAPAAARIDVTLDAESLNGMLATMAPDHVDVGLTGGRGLTIQMQNLKVTGFDPTAGPNGGVTTSLRLLVPELGIDIPVEPHLTLEILATAGGRKASFLRFDKVLLNLPLTALGVYPLALAVPFASVLTVCVRSQPKKFALAPSAGVSKVTEAPVTGLS